MLCRNMAAKWSKKLPCDNQIAMPQAANHHEIVSYFQRTHTLKSSVNLLSLVSLCRNLVIDFL